MYAGAVGSANHSKSRSTRVSGWAAEARGGVDQDHEVDGAKRARTADLLGAIQALSQLSYSPVLAAV